MGEVWCGQSGPIPGFADGAERITAFSVGEETTDKATPPDMECVQAPAEQRPRAVIRERMEPELGFLGRARDPANGLRKVG